MKDNRYCASAHIYAKNINEEITATLYYNNEPVGSRTCSVIEYLDSDYSYNADIKTKKLLKATKLFGCASAEYFYGGNHGYSEALSAYLTEANLTEDDLCESAKDYNFSAYHNDDIGTTEALDAKISLVLDSKTSIRVYIKGIYEGTTAGIYTSVKNNKSDLADFLSYFEIDGLTPKLLNKQYEINIDDTNYTFCALSWAKRVLADNSSASERNVKMAKAIMAYFNAADKYIIKAVKEIKFDQTEIVIPEEHSITLSPILDPPDATETLIWSSSNEAVATVNQNGNVQVKENTKGNSAIITVETSNGISAFCTVWATEKPLTGELD